MIKFGANTFVGSSTINPFSKHNFCTFLRKKFPNLKLNVIDLIVEEASALLTYLHLASFSFSWFLVKWESCVCLWPFSSFFSGLLRCLGKQNQTEKTY